MAVQGGERLIEHISKDFFLTQYLLGIVIARLIAVLFTIGHFRVPLSLSFKPSLSAKLLL